MGQSGKPIKATHSSPPGLSMATRKWGSNYFKGSGSGVTQHPEGPDCVVDREVSQLTQHPEGPDCVVDREVAKLTQHP